MGRYFENIIFIRMSYNGSADEHSEDGELREIPLESASKNKVIEISLSEEENENDDGLDIKPPQARSSHQNSKKRREEHERYKKTERHKEERHSHRERRREKHHRSDKDRQHHQREKERYYRDVHYSSESQSQSHYVEREQHREKKEYLRNQSHRYEEVASSVGDKRGSRYERELEKYKHRRYEEQKHVRHRDKRHKEVEYVDEQKEEEMQGNNEERSKWDDNEKELTEEERAEQDSRKLKLLEAEREMARLKEQSRLDREKRDKTKRKQDDEDFYNKRMKVEEEEEEELKVSESEEEVAAQSENEERSDYSERSRNSSVSQSHSERSYQSGDSREASPASDRSKSRSRSNSRTRSRSRSQSPSRSRTSSPVSEPTAEKVVEPVSEKPEENNVEKKEVKEKPKIDESLPPYYPAIQGCRSVVEFQTLNRIEEGTYGVVFRAKDKRTDEIVALKRLKMEKEKEGFPITSLREINTLLKGQHPNIVTVREIVVGSNMDKIYIVMDYVEHDLKSLMETMRHKKQKFMPGEVKCLLNQLLLAVAHLHDNWILHRDLKTSNLLLSHKGILKVGDFGLAREYDSPLKAYTPIVVTLWYRAPELLLCTKEYSTPIDMWSVGCIFAEFLLMNALFPGKTEVEQVNKIFKELGTPNETIWPGYNELPAVKKMTFNRFPVSNLRSKFNNLSEIGLGLLLKFLTYDPVKRTTAEEALQSPYFLEHPLPIDPAMFPTWPAKSELGLKRAMAASPKPPSGGGAYKKLGGDGFTLGMGVDLRRGGAGFSLKF
ncbi:unnamed protein product [Brassicogethes aeneus]|uniref:cyclin-dependent kinase n=1 Tax=Brassicogethes aeneus TaxID=1431903 RepID=A0A9P0B1F0_BRAAE|nr:unnamed protein product [Brassicogethes aeneus]